MQFAEEAVSGIVDLSSILYSLYHFFCREAGYPGDVKGSGSGSWLLIYRN